MRTALFLIAVIALSCTRSAAVSAQNGSLTGIVRDARGGPAQAVRVSIPELRVGTVTDSNGRFAIHNIPYGEYRVVVSYTGLSSLSRTVRITPGQTSEQVFVVGALDNPTVEVRVTGGMGARVNVDGRYYGPPPGPFVLQPGSRRLKAYHPDAPRRFCRWTVNDLLPGDSRCYVCNLSTGRHRSC